MAWRWVRRRHLTIGFVVSFAGWYLVQLAVASAFGTETAVWWFYFTNDPSPGSLLAPISHNLADAGHLRRNAVVLLVAGGLAEPYLERRQYAALLIAVSFASIAVANMLSLAFGTQWTLAGPSGGIYGLWAYVGVRNRSVILDTDGWRDFVEAAFVLVGAFAIVVVPLFDLRATGAINVSHALGIVLGYGIAFVETSPWRHSG